VRTIQRWYHEKSSQLFADERPTANRPVPANKLSVKERALIIDTCNLSEFANYPPGYIVPTLADNSRYIGSESTFYRVLKEAGQIAERTATKMVTVHQGCIDTTKYLFSLIQTILLRDPAGVALLGYDR
jgi:putative transposase